MDIVKLASIIFSKRDEMKSSNRRLAATFCLSTMVLIIQISVLAYLAGDVEDITFCGDIVRHLDLTGPMEQIFKKNGRDAKSKYTDLWEEQYVTAAKEDLRKERDRTYTVDFYPSCNEDSGELLELQGRLKYYSDAECT